MTRETSARVLVGLSILYGVVIAALAAADVAVAPTAVVGGMIIGGLWVVRGLAYRRGS